MHEFLGQWWRSEGTGLAIDVEPPWPVGWSPDDWCKDLKLPFQCEQLRILLPCAGFDAPGRALRHMKIPYRLAGLWEIDESASRVLRKMYSGGSDASALHIGWSAGDFLKVSAQDLPNADALIRALPALRFRGLGCMEDGRMSGQASFCIFCGQLRNWFGGDV